MSNNKEIVRELIAACKAQHNALDNLLMTICALRLGYEPSEDVLLALEAGRTAIVNATQS